jgi:hypothetical protein
MNKTWWVERSQEPSTYQGLSILAGLFGQWFFGSAELGQQALQCGLAVAAVIQVGKVEAVIPNNAPSIDRNWILAGTVVEVRQGVVWLRRGRCLRVDGVLRLDGALIITGSL